MTPDDTTYGAALTFLALCGFAAAALGIACWIADITTRTRARLRRHPRQENRP